MALAPSLSLSNDYPDGSLSRVLFDAVLDTLEKPSLPAEDLDPENKDGIARVNTFCDSVLISDALLELCSGLLQKQSLEPFSISDFGIQFGPAARQRCEGITKSDFRQLTYSELETHFSSEMRSVPAPSFLVEEPAIALRSREFLSQGLSRLALDALIQDLARAVGADDPETYSLSEPYSPNQIKDAPYLRLRLGFTYEEIVQLVRKYYSAVWHPSRLPELIVSDLLDTFIDHGAIVPTFTLHRSKCTRVYRKGEANPRWDDEFTRLLFTLKKMPDAERAEVLEGGRTRIAKINAILALSGVYNTGLTTGALERGNVGMLLNSVVEREGTELTGLMRRFGLLN